MTLMRLFISMAACGLVASSAGIQPAAAPPVLRSRRVVATVALKIYNPSGSTRLVGWDRDSVVVRGRVPSRDRFFFNGDSASMKLGIEERSASEPVQPVDLIVYLPRRGSVAIKSVDASIAATDISGWFYTVSGAIVLAGRAQNADAESMSGDVMLDLTTPWVRARTGRGHLVVRGAPEDVDASTVGGTLDVLTSSIMRGRFASVTGDVRYMADVASGSLFDFSNHSGAIDLALPRSVSATLDLSTVAGLIDDQFAQVKPAAAPGRWLQTRLGGGDARIVARTFKGAIRVRPL